MSKTFLEIRLRFPPKLSGMFSRLPIDIRKKVLRSALRGAVSPLRSAVKTISRQVAQQSKRKQGTGAMSRSIISKIGSPKGHPNVVYGLVGVDRRHTEFMFNKPGGIKHGNRFHQVQTKTPLGRDRRNRRTLTSRAKSIYTRNKQVRSYYRTTFSRNKTKASPNTIKRRPIKYFHLVDMGFRHWRNGSQVRERDILDRAWVRSFTKVDQRFKRNLTQRIIQLAKKHAARVR